MKESSSFRKLRHAPIAAWLFLVAPAAIVAPAMAAAPPPIPKPGPSTALGAVAPQLGSGEAEFVAQRPRQRFLFHHVYAPLLAVDILDFWPQPAGPWRRHSLQGHRDGAGRC